MVQTRSCDYCGSDIEPGTGTMMVYVNGRVVHFCSSKCENNADLGRPSRTLEWTAEGQRIGASRAGPSDEVEQVAAEPAAEDDETVADDLDVAADETEAEAVAATAGDAGSETTSEDLAAEDETESVPGEEADPDEAEATVGDDMVRESDADDADEDDQ